MNGEIVDAVRPSQPWLRLRLLGGCEFQRPDGPVRPETAKTGALLAFLAMQSAPQQTVEFNRDSSYWLDVEAFSQRVNEVMRQRGNEATRRQGYSLPHRPVDSFTHQLVTSLTEAVRLYRGDFLEGFYVRGAPAFEEWVLAERERLRTLVLLALRQLVQHHAARGEHAAGIGYAARLLAMDPWREEAHREMMRLLALTGQRSAALAQY